MKEKTIAEELKRAATKYRDDFGDDAFIAGAQWQKEQFEKNRLAACDNQTKEEYERETDFATSIIEKEHRQPTFSDAINYGMRLQKEREPAECLKDALIEWAKFVLKCQEEELAKYDDLCYRKAYIMGKIDAYKVLIAKLNSL